MLQSYRNICIYKKELDLVDQRTQALDVVDEHLNVIKHCQEEISKQPDKIRQEIEGLSVAANKLESRLPGGLGDLDSKIRQAKQYLAKANAVLESSTFEENWREVVNAANFEVCAQKLFKEASDGLKRVLKLQRKVDIEVTNTNQTLSSLIDILIHMRLQRPNMHMLAI